MHDTPYVDFKAVKASVSMLQILDHYGLTERFKRSGHSLSGACPLHNGDNRRQFRVSASKNCWNCFGKCKRGGNVLDFVALKENISAREAAIHISEWFGLQFDEPGGKTNSPAIEKTPATTSQRAAKSEAVGNNAAGTNINKPLGFQLQNLESHPYLTKRGLMAQTIKEFGVGFCGYGTMNGGIVIPIHNPEGKLVAYAGRWPGSPPKDTPKYKLPGGFKKSLELFNIHRAVQAPPEQPLVIVEGYFDCIKLAQLGLRRVVALMGRTISPAQKELIRKHTNSRSRVLVMLDADDAGRAGRDEIVQRLARFVFVKAHVFDTEGKQPENLTAEEVATVFGGVQ